MSGTDRLNQVKLVVFDVDGVFTDGRKWQDVNGAWRRYFSVRDTMGIRALRKAGYRVAVVTSGASDEVRAHMAFVGVDEFNDGCFDKALTVTEMMARLGLETSETAYVSEDLCDAGLFEAIGFGVTVPTARLELQRVARFVTSRSGGDGAVLEICNLILQHTQKGATQNRDPRVASL
ncbi:MAG: hypothetical protein V4760_07400 [Bdellovibrionota bacterium]